MIQIFIVSQTIQITVINNGTVPKKRKYLKIFFSKKKVFKIFKNANLIYCTDQTHLKGRFSQYLKPFKIVYLTRLI